MQRLLALVILALAPAARAAEFGGFKVTTNRTIDGSSLETIVRDVVARAGAKTNDEKAIALYEYLHSAVFHRAYPREARPQSVGPLKVLNAYGWCLCGGQHTVLKALFEAAGWPCRYVGWPGHTTIEVKYDGTWHYFDVFLKCYYWSRDKTHVVGQAEIAADPGLVLDAVKDGRAARQNLCCGDDPADVVAVCKARREVGDVKGWEAVTWRDEGYSPLLGLPAGAGLRLGWEAEAGGYAVAGDPPVHTCGTKDYRGDPVLGPVAEHYGPRSWATGHLVYAPDFARPREVADVQLDGATARGGKLVATAGRGRAVFKLPLPYPYVSAKLAAAFDGDGTLAVSADGGKTWTPAPAGDISALVRQRYDVWVRAEFAGSLRSLRLAAVVEHNRGVVPHLMPGKNRVTVALDRRDVPTDAAVTVTYAYQEATAPGKRTRWDGRGVTYGPVQTVTREVTAVPFTFDINVGGNTPPKMISLERAVRGRE